MSEDRDIIEQAVNDFYSQEEARLADEQAAIAAPEQETPPQPEQTEGASGQEIEAAASPAVSQQPTQPEEDPIDKRFRGMQSLIDKKFNTLLERLETLAPRQSSPEPQQPEDLQDVLATPEGQQRYVESLVDKAMQKKYGLDEQATAEMKLQAEVSAYRRDPEFSEEHQAYAPLVLKVVDEFRQLGIPVDRRSLSLAHRVARGLTVKMLEMVEASRQPAAGEAAAAKKPATPPPTNGRIVTPEKRTALQQQATTLKPQTGVALAGTPLRQARDEQEAVELAMERLGLTDADF